MKLKLLTLMCLMATAVFISCSKDDDDKKDDPTTSASVEGTWLLTHQSVTVNFGTGDTTINTYGDMDTCEMDNRIRFNADKTITTLFWALKCDPNEPESAVMGNWSMSGDNKRLTIADGSVSVYDVVTLSSSTLKLRMNANDNGLPYVVNATFSRK